MQFIVEGEANMSSTGTSLSRYDALIEAVREIALLEPGWNDYKDDHDVQSLRGSTVGVSTLNDAVRIIDAAEQVGVLPASVNPLDDGGVIFQWSFAPVFATLEVKHDDYVIMHQFDSSTDASRFAEFDALPDNLEDFLTGFITT